MWKPRFPFAGNHGLGVAITEVCLSNRPASSIDLPEDDGCVAYRASRRPAQALIAASADLNGHRDGIEVRLEHWFTQLSRFASMN
jgi:hypothetical protein